MSVQFLVIGLIAIRSHHVCDDVWRSLHLPFQSPAPYRPAIQICVCGCTAPRDHAVSGSGYARHTFSDLDTPFALALLANRGAHTVCRTCTAGKSCNSAGAPRSLSRLSSHVHRSQCSLHILSILVRYSVASQNVPHTCPPNWGGMISSHHSRFASTSATTASRNVSTTISIRLKRRTFTNIAILSLLCLPRSLINPSPRISPTNFSKTCFSACPSISRSRNSLNTLENQNLEPPVAGATHTSNPGAYAALALLADRLIFP